MFAFAFSSKKFRRKKSTSFVSSLGVSLLEDCILDYTHATRKSSECEEMASSSEASKAEVNDDTAVTTTSRNNNNNPFAREQEKREGHFDAEGKNELTSQTPSSSSPKISDGRTNDDGEKEGEEDKKEEEQENKRDVSDISRIRFRRQSSVHDIGPIELSSTKTTVLDIKEKLKQFVTEEEQRAKKNEEKKDGGKTSSITNNLTTDDIKILYLGKVLDGCDDATLFQIGIPAAGITTIMHAHVVPPNMRRRSSAQKLATLGTKLLLSGGEVNGNGNAQPSCCSIQ